MNYLYFRKDNKLLLAEDKDSLPEGAKFIAYVHGNNGPGLAFTDWYRATYPETLALSVCTKPQNNGMWELEVNTS